MFKKLLLSALIITSCEFITSCSSDSVTPKVVPTITSFTPTDGVTGTTVTITGTNFSGTGANTVKFNGTEAVVTASTATSITTSVPSAAAGGAGAITVVAGGQTGTSTDNFRVDLLFKASMDGISESSPNASTATGAAILTYNIVTKNFTVVVTYTGLTPTAGHIHKGALGVAGPVVYPFANPITSPVTYTTTTPLTITQEGDLITGLNYANLHTVTFPGGEIRGQLVKQ